MQASRTSRRNSQMLGKGWAAWINRNNTQTFFPSLFIRRIAGVSGAFSGTDLASKGPTTPSFPPVTACWNGARPLTGKNHCGPAHSARLSSSRQTPETGIIISVRRKSRYYPETGGKTHESYKDTSICWRIHRCIQYSEWPGRGS